MHPNTSYFVYNAENSISSGGYFYHHRTMVGTLCGIIHMLFAGNVATSDRGYSGWDILHRMMVFYHDVFVSGRIPSVSTAVQHVPDLGKMVGVLNLLSLCCIVLWSNAFSPDTYGKSDDIDINIQDKFGINGMTAYLRRKCAYMKKISRVTLQWLTAKYAIKVPNSDLHQGLVTAVLEPFVGNIITQMMLYFDIASSSGLNPRLGISSRECLVSQLLDPFHEYPGISGWVTRHVEDKPGSILYKFDSNLKPVALSSPFTSESKCFMLSSYHVSVTYNLDVRSSESGLLTSHTSR